MRRRLYFLTALVATLLFAAPALAQKDLGKAHALDKEGAKAYGEGRYADAIKSFEEAYRLGGPAFELWNIAKCHLRLDQPAEAGDYLEKYLATPNLPKDDREEAQHQLDELKKRRTSTITVTSSPAGATVKIDGKEQPGVTPLTVTLQPGAHTVVVSAPTGIPSTQRVEARYGRALNVEAELKEGGPPRPPPPPNPYDHSDRGTIAIRAAIRGRRAEVGQHRRLCGRGVPRIGDVSSRGDRQRRALRRRHVHGDPEIIGRTTAAPRTT